MPETCCAEVPAPDGKQTAQVNRELSGGTGMSPGGAYGGYYDEHEATEFVICLVLEALK